MECSQILDLFSPLATLIAAFAGSWFAFYLQDKKECRKEEKLQISSINQALFSLIRQYQSLFNITKEIEAWREDDLRYINLPALSTNEFHDIKINPETLSFLLDSSEPTLLMEIVLERERFEMALKSIELRSNNHVHKLQPEMERNGIKPGDLIRVGDLELKIGFFILGMLKNETDQVYRHVDDTLNSTRTVLTKLLAYAKRTYPNKKFVRMAEADTSNPPIVT